MAGGFTEVFPSKGPLIGRKYVSIPDDQVAAATATNGWASKLVPGYFLQVYPDEPWDTEWVIPGWDPEAVPPPFPEPGPEPDPETQPV